MATSMADLGFNIDSSPMRRAIRDLDRMSGASGKAERSTRQFESAANAAKAAVTGLIAAIGVREIVQYADAWTNVQNQLRVVTDSQTELAQVSERVVSIARETRASLQGTSQLYSRFRRGVDDTVASDEQLLNVTRTINQALAISGATAAEAEGALRQLAQGIASGTLRGEEFNSVSEQAPGILRAVSQETGMTVGALREFAAQGGITAELLITSLENYAETADKEFAASTRSMSASLEVARTNAIEFAGSSDALTNSVGAAGDAIVYLSENLDYLVNVAATGAAVVGSRFVGVMALSTAEYVRNAAASRAATVAKVAEAKETVSLSRVEEAKTAATTRSTKASLASAAAAVKSTQAVLSQLAAERSLESVRLKAQINDIGRTKTLARMAEIRRAESAITAQLTAQKAALTRQEQALSAATINQALARESATAAATRHAAAQSRATIAMTAATAAANGLRAALSFVGGPAGAAVLAGAGILYYLSQAETAAERTKRLADEVNGLVSSFENMDRSATIRQLKDYESQAESARQRIAEINSEIQSLQGQRMGGSSPFSQGRAAAARARIIELQEEAAELSDQIRVADGTAFELQKRLYGIAEGGDPFEVPASGAASLAESGEKAAGAMASVLGEIERARELMEYGIGADEDPFAPVERSARNAIVSVSDLLEEAQFLKQYGFEYGDDPFADFSGSAEEAAKDTEKEFDRAAERVADTLQRTIASGDWQGIGDMVGATLASSIGGKVSKAIGGDVLGPLMGGIAGGVVQLAISEAIRYASEIDDPTQRRQATQGTGTVLGSIDEKSQSISDAVEGIESTNDQLVNINTGMLSALRSLQTGIAGASGGAARAAGRVDADLSIQKSVFDYIPVVGQLDDILGGGLSDLFGGKSKLVDEGIQLMGGALSDLAGQTMSGALVSAYNTVAKKKHFLDDYDNYTQVTALSDSVQQQFAQVFGGIAESVMAGAEAIGIAPQSVQDALDRFVVESQKISLEGMNAEERAAELESVFSSIFDGAVTAAVPFVRRFQMAGEGLGETLARVATEVELFKESQQTLGIYVFSSAERVAELSNQLINAAGGAEQFSNDLVAFENNFLSAAETLETNERRLREALGGLGLPETREQYLQLVRVQDASTKSGAENIATLLRLQDAADQYYTALEREQEEALQKQQEIANERLSLEERWLSLTGHTAEIRRRELEALDPSNRYLQERIWALQDERESVQGVVAARREALNSEIAIQRAHAQSAQEAANAVQSALGRMVMDTREVRMRSQQSALSALQASVRSGSVTAGDSLDRNLSAATAIQMSDYATFGEYVRDYTRTTSTLVQLKEITDRQVTTEERMLSNLEKQLNSMDGLRKELEQSQLAIIKQTNKTAKILERFEVDGIEVRA